MRQRILREIRQARADLDWLVQVRPEVWLRLLVLPALFGIWAWLAQILPTGFFAGPLLTLEALADLLMDSRRDFPIALGATLSVYLGGLGLAAAVGVPLGLFLGSVPLLGRTASPYLHALAATPVVALIPLIILLLGLGWEAKIAIVALTAVMPVMINTQLGVQRIDPDLLQMARAYGLGRRARLLHVVLPGAVPAIMAGLRLAAVMGLVATAIADIYTAMTGLGALLQAYGNSFRMDRYLAVVLTFAAIGSVTTGALTWIERRLTPPPARARITH